MKTAMLWRLGEHGLSPAMIADLQNCTCPGITESGNGSTGPPKSESLYR